VLPYLPLKIKDITFKTSIAIAPMCQYSAVDGFANDWHLVHLGSRAIGRRFNYSKPAVSPEGRISPEDLGIWKDDRKLQQINQFISGQNAVPGIQLAHAGRKQVFRSLEW
jgi:2,4-dienoyl-CoA reductase-like NADH-dependent reductase (Old Yellow Enzyme family)